MGAGLSIISMIPGVGDAIGKPLKGTKLAKKLAQLEQQIKTVTQQLAKARGVDLAAVQKTVNSTKQVVKAEVLKRMPKNWPQVSKIIGKKYNKSLLPSDYHEKLINGKPVIFRNPNRGNDAITTPLAIDKNGKIVVKQLPDRISDPKVMRANYATAYGKLKGGYQIHHIFPDNLIRSMPIGQAAEKAGVSLDRAENLIGLPGKDVAKQGDIGHWSSHPQYDALVERIVKPYQTRLIDKYGSLDLVPADKLREVMDEISDTLRDLIERGKVPMKDGRISMNMTGSEAVA